MLPSSPADLHLAIAMRPVFYFLSHGKEGKAQRSTAEEAAHTRSTPSHLPSPLKVHSNVFGQQKDKQTPAKVKLIRSRLELETFSVLD
jgi:hypothetical protein